MRWLVVLWLAWCCAAAGAQAPAPELAADAAACRIERLSTRVVQSPADGARPDDAAPWQPVAALPDDWSKRWPGYTGTVWYRIDFRRDCDDAAATATPRAQTALAIDFIVMAGEVFINDDRLWRDARLAEPLSRSWNTPRIWRLPESALHAGVNTVWVRVVGTAQQTPGLGPVHLGEPQALQQLHDSQWWRHRALFAVNLIVSSVLGAVFFCLWVTRRTQSAYGWYALMALLWGLFISNVLVTTPWPFSTTLMAMRANSMALVLYIACFCIFIWRFGGQVLPRVERALWLLSTALLALLALVPDAFLAEASVVIAVTVAALYVVNCLQFAWHAWRTREREQVLLALSLLVFVGAIVHDLLFMLKVIAGLTPFTPYTSIASLFCLSAVLALRHARSVRRIERFNDELAEGIARARSELGDTLEREHALALTNNRLQDRLQIAHDLHDGLGGSLVRMMALVEQAEKPLQNQQVLSFLKLIRDDLRQTIDSGSSAGVQVPVTPQAWIAPLRHRFVQLFDELGIDSQWTFPPQWRMPPDALQCLALTRLVEEALVNVLKHSRARRVQADLQQTRSGRLQLCIEDDGVGFDVEAVRQAGISVGMRSMQARIARVGGTLEVVSRPGRTRLTIQLEPPGAHPA